MKVLGVRQSLSQKDLCIQFGCLKLEPVVKRGLEEYQKRVEEGSNCHVDIRLPKIVGAVFYLVAKAYKTRIDKSKLLSALGIQARELNQTVDQVGRKMEDIFGGGEDSKRVKRPLERTENQNVDVNLSKSSKKSKKSCSTQLTEAQLRDLIEHSQQGSLEGSNVAQEGQPLVAT